MFAARRCGGGGAKFWHCRNCSGWKSRTRPGGFFLWKTMGKAAAQDCCHTMVFGGLTILPLQHEEGQDGCFILARSWGGS